MQETIIQSIVVVTIFFVVLLTMIIVLLNRHYRSEKQKTKEIFKEVVKAQEEERTRIANNIHDDLGSLLTSARITLQNYIDDKNVDSLSHLSETLDLARKSAKEASSALSPSLLSKHGLMGAINDIPNLYSFSKVKFNIDVNISVQLDGYLETTIFRIINEAVNNSIKYSNCNEISISVYDVNKTISLTIEDDGIGFDIYSIGRESNGIKNIRSRVKSINAKLQLVTDRGKGCKYTIII